MQQAGIYNDLPGTMLDSWKINEVEIDNQKLYEPANDGERKEVLAALKEPKMKIKNLNGFVVRYSEYSVYTLIGGFNVLGEKKENYTVFYPTRGMYCETEHLFLDRGNFHRDNFVNFVKVGMCLIPGTNKLVQVAAR